MYKKERKGYKLKFEDYEGLEVTVGSLSIDKLLSLTELASNLDSDDAGIEQSRELIKVFADALVSWNLGTEDGKAVPATYEGVLTQEFDFILEIIMAWMNQMASVSPNLEKNLNTMQSLESLPMVTQESQQ